MRKVFPALVVIAILVVGYFFVSMKYNNTALVYSQKTERNWADVETAYQRRSDLIGNLVNTVKRAADFEKSTLEAVISARAKATQVAVDPTNITPEKMAEFQEAQSGVSSALSRLLVTVEQYPTLKANENFLKLQDELASTENQILTARTRFNTAVEEYNTYVLTMPNKFFLSDYKEKAFFKSDKGAEKAPEVKF